MPKKSLPTTPSTPQKRVCRQFTPEYRAQVIALILQEQRSVASVSHELGISASLIYDWLKKAQPSVPPTTEKGSVHLPLRVKKTVMPADYASELAKLRKENDELKEEREILKKFTLFQGEALGIFAKAPR